MNELLFFAHYATVLLTIKIGEKIGKYALAALFSAFVLLANLFILKEISLFGLTVTPVETYSIGAMLIVGLIQEKYGKETADQIVNTMLLVLIFFALMCLFQIGYVPHSEDKFHPAYVSILSPSPRILISSILVAVSMHKLNLFLLRKSEEKFSHLSFAVRQTAILLAVQLLDTILFSFIALYGIMSKLTDIIVMSFSIKVITISLMGPMLHLVRRNRKAT